MDFLAKYYPKLEVYEKFDDDVTGLTTEERAFASWKQLLQVRKGQQALFIITGKILKRIRDEKLYEILDYENFTAFCNSEELSMSREKAYVCIRAFEYLVEHLGLDPKYVADINISRIIMMIPVLKKIEGAQGKQAVIEKIEEYQQLRHADFVREIKKDKLANEGSKPVVYWSEEHECWLVKYFENTTLLQSLGQYVAEETDGEETYSST